MLALTDVMILKIFSPKIWRKIWRFLLKLQLVFEKRPIFFTKDCQKFAENCYHSIDPWSR
jgi:hypothetical protein